MKILTLLLLVVDFLINSHSNKTTRYQYTDEAIVKAIREKKQNSANVSYRTVVEAHGVPCMTLQNTFPSVRDNNILLTCILKIQETDLVAYAIYRKRLLALVT